MIEAKDIILKSFKTDDKVFVMSKGYPVYCSVIEKRMKNSNEGYYLLILDDNVIKELGTDKLWLPTKMIEESVEA
jgi:hypothetical protein